MKAPSYLVRSETRAPGVVEAARTLRFVDEDGDCGWTCDDQVEWPSVSSHRALQLGRHSFIAASSAEVAGRLKARDRSFSMNWPAHASQNGPRGTERAFELALFCASSALARS